MFNSSQNLTLLKLISQNEALLKIQNELDTLEPLNNLVPVKT